MLIDAVSPKLEPSKVKPIGILDVCGREGEDNWNHPEVTFPKMLHNYVSFSSYEVQARMVYIKIIS